MRAKISRSCRGWDPSFLRFPHQATFRIPGTGWDKSSCIREFASLWRAGKCRADKRKFTLTLPIFKCGTSTSRSWGSQGLKIKFFRTATHPESWWSRVLKVPQHWFGGILMTLKWFMRDQEDIQTGASCKSISLLLFWGHNLSRFSFTCFIPCFSVGSWCYRSQKCEQPQCRGTAKQFIFPITLVILLLCKGAAKRNNAKKNHYLWPCQC